MTALADWLLVLAATLAAVLLLVIVPWCVIAWRELGEPKAKHRHRPGIPHLEPWEPSRLATVAEVNDSTRVDLPPVPCLQEDWMRETLAMIEECSA